LDTVLSQFIPIRIFTTYFRKIRATLKMGIDAGRWPSVKFQRVSFVINVDHFSVFLTDSGASA